VTIHIVLKQKSVRHLNTDILL